MAPPSAELHVWPRLRARLQVCPLPLPWEYPLPPASSPGLCGLLKLLELLILMLGPVRWEADSLHPHWCVFCHKPEARSGVKESTPRTGKSNTLVQKPKQFEDLFSRDCCCET